MSCCVCIVVLFVFLLGFWFLLSGRFDVLLFLLGVVLVLLVIWLVVLVFDAALGDFACIFCVYLLWLVVYFVWLVTRILAVVVIVAWVVFDFCLLFCFGVVWFFISLFNLVVRMLFVILIMVVFGTIIVDVDEDGVFVVYAFIFDVVDDLVDVLMQNCIVCVFRCEFELLLMMWWDLIHDELLEEFL